MNSNFWILLKDNALDSLQIEENTKVLQSLDLGYRLDSSLDGATKSSVAAAGSPAPAPSLDRAVSIASPSIESAKNESSRSAAPASAARTNDRSGARKALLQWAQNATKK